MRVSLFRGAVTSLTALAVLAPLGLVLYQAFLNGPFFQPTTRFSLSAFSFVFADADFWAAFLNTVILATGMALIAAPLGSFLAFLVTRTDLPGRSWLEPLLLVPIFLSPLVLAFGYVVALGPVGFVSTLAQDVLGFVPWNIYSMTALVLIAGLTHVPHVYLYTAAALRGLGTGVMEPLWERLGELTLPVTLVVGERDEKFRAIGERMAAGLPDARLVVVPGAGHAVQLEAPEVVSDHLAAGVRR
jgi:iron(III) transport system permease protein